GGETLRLFVPQIVYLGFTTTIPPGWEDAECFHFEQRGWLEPWGHGAHALLLQARTQQVGGLEAAAESTLRRVRALEGAADQPPVPASPAGIPPAAVPSGAPFSSASAK